MSIIDEIAKLKRLLTILGYEKRLTRIERKNIWTLTPVRSINGTLPDGKGDVTVAASITNNSSTQKIKVDKGGSLIATRQELNLIEGSNVTLTVADNSGSDRVDVTIAASTSATTPSIARTFLLMGA